MSLRRPASSGTVLGLTVAAALALAACQAPEPRVTVFSGSTSRSLEAACWNDQDAPVRSDCVPTTSALLKVRPGATIGVSVDPKVADAGWIVDINGQPIVNQPVDQGRITDSYFRFVLTQQDVDALTQDGSDDAVLKVTAVTGKGSQAQPRGVWIFHLRLLR
jgi:hypothetical protein